MSTPSPSPHPDYSTEWMMRGSPRRVDVPHPRPLVCIHGLKLFISCTQCQIDWRNYATNNGGF